jgi:protein gp37
VVVEDRQYVPASDSRIDALRCTNAAVRFLSIDPLLEGLSEIDLSAIGSSWAAKVEYVGDH